MKKEYNRREFLKSAFSTAAIAGSGALFSLFRCSSAEKLNFIIINVDDLGWTDLGCYGSTYYETPNIDQLASKGVRFTNAYAACAVCSPTRAAIMTGRYPARTGVTDWIHHLDKKAEAAVKNKKNPTEYVGNVNNKLLCPPNPYWMELDEVTIAEMLKMSGYTTCHVGKWHLGPYYWFPDKQGFDYNYGGTEIGQPPSYFDPYYLNERRPSISTLPPRLKGEYLTDRETDEACKFITSHADKPFFLNMCHYAVHTPLQAKTETVDKYNKKQKTNHDNPVYAAMIESVDSAAGKIIGTLEALKILDKTVIIFTSDNGGLKGHSTDNSPLRSGKGYPYEGGIRVPLIVYWRGAAEEGTEKDVPVSSIDLFPTICEAAGIALPADHVIDGESIIPALTRSEDLRRKALFWHFPHYRGRDVVPYSIIRKGDWKLIKRYEGKTFELFNLKTDLSETADLSEKMPDKVTELDMDLRKWLTESKAKLPINNPDYITKK